MYDPKDDELDFEHHIKYENGMNSSENKLYDAMKIVGLSPMPQYKISRMTVDFAFPEEKLVIELNGPYHNKKEQIIKDKKRWFVLQKLGWERKTFDSYRIYEDPIQVAFIIRDMLKKLSEKGDDPSKKEKELDDDEISSAINNVWKS